MILGLSLLDVIALVFFLTAWLGFAALLRWRREYLKVAAAMVDHRRAWMHAMLGRDVRMIDALIVANIMSSAAFFASTAVVVVGALLGVLLNIERGARPSAAQWYMITPRQPVEIKLALILIVALYAFMSFTWSIRQANYLAVTMGAAPPPPVDSELRERLAFNMADIVSQVAASYDSGMRSYYFGLSAVSWILGPALFSFATIAVVVLLLRRQTQSGTALALEEMAAARRGDANT